MTFLLNRTTGLLLAALLVAGLALPDRAEAQLPLSFELRGGSSVGGYEQTRAGVETNPSFSLGLRAEYAVASYLGVYAGYDYARFGCEGGFCQGTTVSFAASGLTTGVRAGWLTRSGPTVHAGLVYHTLSSDAGDGAYEYTSDRGLGFNAGLGYTISLSPTWHLTPGLSYTRYTVTNDAGADSAVVVLSGSIGLRYAL